MCTLLDYECFIIKSNGGKSYGIGDGNMISTHHKEKENKSVDETCGSLSLSRLDYLHIMTSLFFFH